MKPSVVWGERALIGALLGLVCVWFAVSLWYPFGWDQGIFAWAGDVVNRGGLPYRDAWDVKGPLSYYGYALAQRLLGHNLWGIRVFDGLLLAAGGLFLYRLAKTRVQRILAVWAALVFIGWYASGSYWHTAQPDGWAAILILAAVAMVAGGSHGPALSRCFLAGLLTGGACLVKPLFCVFLAVPVWALLLLFRLPSRRRAANVACLMAGLLVPVALTVAWFQHLGILDEFLEENLIYTATVYSPLRGAPLQSLLAGLGGSIWASNPMLIMALPAMLGLAMLVLAEWRMAVVAGLWLALALFCVTVQNRFYAYHWIPAFAPLVFLAVSGFDAVRSGALQRLAGARLRRVSWLPGILWLFAATAAACSPIRFDIARWTGLVTGRIAPETYYAGFGTAELEMEIASYLRSRTGEQESVAIWGWETSILYMADRRSSSRFGFSMPLLAGGESALKAKYQREFLNSLYSSPPAFIVAGTLAEGVLGRKAGPADFPELYDFLFARCVEEQQFGPFRVYRVLRGGSTGTSVPALNPAFQDGLD